MKDSRFSQSMSINKHSCATVSYLVIGVWGVHLLHIARFYLVNWTVISAFPNYAITIRTSMFLSFLLLPLSTVAMLLIKRYGRIWVFVGCFLMVELTSQTIGRSLIKFVIDVGIWGVIAGNSCLFRLYDIKQISTATETNLRILHAEILGILRTVVNVCLFAIGTLGITVVSRLISQYFDNELGQGTAWCYIGGILYVSIGMVYFLIVPLYHLMVKVRERIV